MWPWCCGFPTTPAGETIIPYVHILTFTNHQNPPQSTRICVHQFHKSDNLPSRLSFVYMNHNSVILVGQSCIAQQKYWVLQRAIYSYCEMSLKIWPVLILKLDFACSSASWLVWLTPLADKDNIAIEITIISHHRSHMSSLSSNWGFDHTLKIFKYLMSAGWDKITNQTTCSHSVYSRIERDIQTIVNSTKVTYPHHMSSSCWVGMRENHLELASHYIALTFQLSKFSPMWNRLRNIWTKYFTLLLHILWHYRYRHHQPTVPLSPGLSPMSHAK